jgi:hypothetical protein
LTCTPVPVVDPLDVRACTFCEGSTDPLVMCLREALEVATCDIEFVSDGFCVATSQPISPSETWYEDEGSQEVGGHASWHLGKPGLQYGWLENGTAFAEGETAMFPPWPAVKSTTLPLTLVDGDQDTLLLVLRQPVGPTVTGLVDFRFRRVGDGTGACPIDPNPDCQQLFLP